jgi:hypothetical protein
MSNYAQDSATIQDVLDEAEACDIKIAAARVALGRIGRASRAFASLVALAERSSVLDVNIGWYLNKGTERRWAVTIEFIDGDTLDAVAASGESAVKAVEAKMREHEDIQSGLMEDT